MSELVKELLRIAEIIPADEDGDVSEAEIVIRAAALRLLELEKKASRWVPVSEKAPPFDTRILLYSPKGICAHVAYLIEGFSDAAYCTHWMPLPPPPESVK